MEIIFDLALEVLKHEACLITISDICGELDLLLAFAKTAQAYKWVCPEMTTARVLHIEGGRHPLVELVAPTFVPNDCSLGADSQLSMSSNGHHRALILTGPNHSGKSIFLKQVATIVYLAHIGSFVPADRATIGLTDKMLTRISTRESVTRHESAFANDLRQIAQATRYATSQSLVLIDEFGKGTNAEDGAGLLAATVDEFLSKASEAPRVLIATHCHELFEGDYIDRYPGLCVAQMEVKASHNNDHVSEEFIYLFKVVPGHAISSFGGKCAALNGVPGAIVERADSIARLHAQQEDLATACAKLSSEEEQHLAEAEVVARHFLERDFSVQTTISRSDDYSRTFLKKLLELGF